jgi:hypothetical protein
MESCFTVVVIGGNWLDACEPGTDCLRYDGLTWDEACNIIKLSFDQKYQVALWRQDDQGDDGPDDQGGDC